jgi:L-asparaginase
MSIAVLVTGGTFDKEYNELDGTLSFREPHVGQMLSQGRCRLPVRIQVVMMKDSLEMTREDRDLILHACSACAESRIVITHGTDTMEDTAQFLAGRVGDKTVVLTGAMVPYTFGSSDGLFNLGSALSFVQVLPPGVYLAMNGHCFRAGEVFKDKAQGIFLRKAAQNRPGE